ncbi:sodium:calcium antiporter [Natrarchaeobius halalkaliphilus]|uniref:Sodium:calcium antiporter n=1 Tax=Natrarchaeobius halalkaliphilus TaxID=1679091 RepID=A0A3N6LIM7_9EURY|nr:calcium/sodium antiporter [Natrarchaeobius halalkaliphilus]RQG87776.1 sodium:calcium antiporter [Natrarchaeobius halalkaliphilus]
MSEFVVNGIVLVLGLVFLYAGAELLVAGASRLALSFGLRVATVGVTVVAFATTAPELFVVTVGALSVSTDIGLGAIIGSNVANIGLVLGLTALIRPLSVSPTVLRRHVPFMVFAAALLFVFSLDGRIDRFEGTLFLLVLSGFTVYLLYYIQTDPPALTEYSISDAGSNAHNLALVGAGMLTLVLGSRWLIDGGRGLLSTMGFSDLFIGITVIAFGTSLPELAASVVGAIRGETGFSIGNVIGSNIYNILAVIGITSLIVPITVSPATLQFELVVLVIFTLVLVGMMIRNRELTRVDGAILVSGYLVFLYLLLP